MHELNVTNGTAGKHDRSVDCLIAYDELEIEIGDTPLRCHVCGQVIVDQGVVTNALLTATIVNHWQQYHTDSPEATYVQATGSRGRLVHIERADSARTNRLRHADGRRVVWTICGTSLWDPLPATGPVSCQQCARRAARNRN